MITRAGGFLYLRPTIHGPHPKAGNNCSSHRFVLFAAARFENDSFTLDESCLNYLIQRLRNLYL